MRQGGDRLAERLHAVLLNANGQIEGRIAEIIWAVRSKTSEWLVGAVRNGVVCTKFEVPLGGNSERTHQSLVHNTMGEADGQDEVEE